MHNQVQTLKKLAHVHECAQGFADAVKAVCAAQDELNQAYVEWRNQNRCEHVFIERGSVLWKQMMLSTEPYYRALTNAKARKRRAEKKLLQAVEGGL